MAGGWSAGVRGESEGGIGARTTGRAEFRNVEAPGECPVSVNAFGSSCTLGLAFMSLLRLLPALRTPPLQRTCVAALSYSVPRLAEGSQSAKDQAVFFDDFVNKNAPTPSAAESQTWEAPPPVEEDLPPAAPPDSFPRNPAPENPLTAAKQDRSVSAKGFVKPVYAVSVKASRNNTIITFARPPNGEQLLTLTGGKLGFKKSNRNGYEAGYQCAVGIIAAMEAELERRDFDWHLYLNGFGQGRDAMLTALTTAVGAKVKGKLKRITDKTPLKIGGTRGQKTRRV